MLSAPDPRLRLLAQILRHVIQRAARFAGRARALPAAKRLKSGPRPGRCALWSVRIAHTGFDAIEKTLGLIWRSIEACRETVVHSIRPRDALVDVFYRPNKNERNEKLTRPQRMVVRRARDRRRDKMSVREIGMARNYRHILAAHFGDTRSWPATLRKRAIQIHADIEAAGERCAGDIGV